MRFNTTDFNLASNCTLVAEASTLKFSFTNDIYLDNRHFRFIGTDTDREEEVTGWRYKEVATKGQNLLIIND